MKRIVIILLSIVLCSYHMLSAGAAYVSQPVFVSTISDNKGMNSSTGILPSGYEIAQASDGTYYINPPPQYHGYTSYGAMLPIFRLGGILLAGISIFIANTIRYRKTFKELDQFERRRKAQETKATRIVNPNSEQIICPKCSSFIWANEDTCPTCGKKLHDSALVTK